MIFKWKGGHTPFVLDFMKDGECLWNTKCEHATNKTTSENAFAEAELSELAAEDVKFKIRKICTTYADELRQQNKKNCTASLHDINVPKLFCFKQAHSFLPGVCIP